MSTYWHLRTDHEVEMFNKHVAELRLAGKPARVKFVDNRTKDQNNMFYGLYRQIASQKEDESVVDIKRHCKAYYGVPILLAEDEAFAAMYEKGIMQHLTTEEKLLAMDILPVTRRMNKKQGSEYIDIIIREYSKQGVSLINPAEADSYE